MKKPGIQEAVWLGGGGGAPARGRSRDLLPRYWGGTLRLHLPGGTRMLELTPSENFFLQKETKKLFSQETSTLIYGSGRKLAGESVFTNEQWLLWPRRGLEPSVSHSLVV